MKYLIGLVFCSVMLSGWFFFPVKISTTVQLKYPLELWPLNPIEFSFWQLFCAQLSRPICSGIDEILSLLGHVLCHVNINRKKNEFVSRQKNPKHNRKKRKRQIRLSLFLFTYKKFTSVCKTLRWTEWTNTQPKWQNLNFFVVHFSNNLMKL